MNKAQEREAALAFDPRKLPRAFYQDPYPTYRLLREHDPVHRNPDGSFFLTRYADVLAVYRDPRMSSDKQAEFKPKFGAGALYAHHTTSMVFRDPPDHTRLRKLILHFFTPKALHAVEPRVVALIDGLLDRFEDNRRMDLVADYAFALPVEVVCDLLGVPQGHREPLRHWSRAILGALEPVVTRAVIASGNRAVEEFSTFLRELINDKRRRKHAAAADVLATLVHAMDSKHRLSEDELIQNCIFLLNAGHETTTNLIANGVNALLEHAAERARLYSEPGLIRRAIEEFLRFESSNQLGNRATVTDVQLGATHLPPGAQITVCIGAANRDPAQFDEPERLNIARDPNRHLAFAQGIHACAGMSLARLEARIAIGRLVARFPNLEKAGALVRDERVRFRVVKSLPIEG